MLRKFFLKRVRNFFLIMIIPNLILFMLIGGILIHFSKKNMEKEGTDTVINLDKSIDNSLIYVCRQIDLLMNNPRNSLAFRNLFANEKMEQRDRVLLSSLQSIVDSYEVTYPYIHSIYLYMDNMERFFSSVQRKIVSNDNYFDQVWIDEYKSMPESEDIYMTDRWLHMYLYDDPIEVCTVYYRIKYTDGVIVMNIDRKKFEEVMGGFKNSQGQEVFLVNAYGNILCGSLSDDSGYDYRYIEDKFKNISNIDSDTVSIGRVKSLLYAKKNENMNVYTVSIIRWTSLFSELGSYAGIAVLVILLNIFLIFILAHIYTKRSFYYIKECVNVFSAAEKGENIERVQINEQDEYSMILNNIIYLYLTNNKMKMDLLEKQHLSELSEMAALQHQITPHFIFNTLQIMDFEVIGEMGLESSVHRMIKRFSEVMKYTLADPMVRVTFREELEYLKAYLEIQEFRFRAITYFEVDDSILDCRVFRLMLQPMIENCFEHGINGGGDDIVIKVKISDRVENIRVAVLDSGKGMDKDEIKDLSDKIKNRNSKNIGLTNLNRRLTLHYGEESALKIYSKKGFGTIIKFKIAKNIFDN